MTNEQKVTVEFHLVTGDWRDKEFDDEKEAIDAFKIDEHSRFMYRTFLEGDSPLKSTTGKCEFLQERNGGWTSEVSFNNWRIDSIDTRGFAFSIKDPVGEIRRVSDSDELKEIYHAEWPDGYPYIVYVARVLSVLSENKNWDDYDSNQK